MNRAITVSNVEPAPLSFRHPLGVNLDLLLTITDQRGVPVNPTSTFPQLVLLPRSQGGSYPYDMAVHDAVNGVSRAQVPGTSLTDRNGYGLEIYLRQANAVPSDPPLPVSLAATGVMRTQGAAYTSQGPLYLINVPTIVGPPGVQGVKGDTGDQGSTGQRGSVWTAGPGVPVDTGNHLVGDMYLQDNGDVWRFDAATLTWVKGTF